MAKRKDVEQQDGPELVRVRFTKRDAPFETGEERLFPRLEAEKFVRQGVAEEVTGA